MHWRKHLLLQVRAALQNVAIPRRHQSGSPLPCMCTCRHSCCSALRLTTRTYGDSTAARGALRRMVRIPSARARVGMGMLACLCVGSATCMSPWRAARSACRSAWLQPCGTVPRAMGSGVLTCAARARHKLLVSERSQPPFEAVQGDARCGSVGQHRGRRPARPGPPRQGPPAAPGLLPASTPGRRVRPCTRTPCKSACPGACASDAADQSGSCGPRMRGVPAGAALRAGARAALASTCLPACQSYVDECAGHGSQHTRAAQRV